MEATAIVVDGFIVTAALLAAVRAVDVAST